MAFYFPPHLIDFDEFCSPKLSTLFRLDNSRSPTWSIKGEKFKAKTHDDRIIINVPSQLLHLVTYDNNSRPGYYTIDTDDNDTNDDVVDDDDDLPYDPDRILSFFIHTITRINFHYSDSEPCFSPLDEYNSDDDSEYDEDDNNTFCPNSIVKF